MSKLTKIGAHREINPACYKNDWYRTTYEIVCCGFARPDTSAA